MARKYKKVTYTSTPPPARQAASLAEGRPRTTGGGFRPPP